MPLLKSMTDGEARDGRKSSACVTCSDVWTMRLGLAVQLLCLCWGHEQGPLPPGWWEWRGGRWILHWGFGVWAPHANSHHECRPGGIKKLIFSEIINCMLKGTNRHANNTQNQEYDTITSSTKKGYMQANKYIPRNHTNLNHTIFHKAIYSHSSSSFHWLEALFDMHLHVSYT